MGVVVLSERPLEKSKISWWWWSLLGWDGRVVASYRRCNVHLFLLGPITEILSLLSFFVWDYDGHFCWGGWLSTKWWCLVRSSSCCCIPRLTAGTSYRLDRAKPFCLHTHQWPGFTPKRILHKSSQPGTFSWLPAQGRQQQLWWVGRCWPMAGDVPAFCGAWGWRKQHFASPFTLSVFPTWAAPSCPLYPHLEFAETLGRTQPGPAAFLLNVHKDFLFVEVHMSCRLHCLQEILPCFHFK